MITFEKVSKENLYIAKVMMNSNSEFFSSIGKCVKEKESELISSQSSSLLIKIDDTYIGLLNYEKILKERRIIIEDYLIHADYQGFGYGTVAYDHFENLLLEQGYKHSVVLVSSKNDRAHQFWERKGYVASGLEEHKGIEMTRFEKLFTRA